MVNAEIRGQGAFDRSHGSDHQDFDGHGCFPSERARPGPLIETPLGVGVGQLVLKLVTNRGDDPKIVCAANSLQAVNPPEQILERFVILGVFFELQNQRIEPVASLDEFVQKFGAEDRQTCLECRDISRHWSSILNYL